MHDKISEIWDNSIRSVQVSSGLFFCKYGEKFTIAEKNLLNFFHPILMRSEEKGSTDVSCLAREISTS